MEKHSDKIKDFKKLISEMDRETKLLLLLALQSDKDLNQLKVTKEVKDFLENHVDEKKLKEYLKWTTITLPRKVVPLLAIWCMIWIALMIYIVFFDGWFLSNPYFKAFFWISLVIGLAIVAYEGYMRVRIFKQ